MSACVCCFVCLTCAKVGVLLGHVLTLVDPFAVALEEDLKSWLGLTPQLDGVALDDVGINRLLQELGQGCRLAAQCFASGT